MAVSLRAVSIAIEASEVGVRRVRVCTGSFTRHVLPTKRGLAAVEVACAVAAPLVAVHEVPVVALVLLVFAVIVTLLRFPAFSVCCTKRCGSNLRGNVDSLQVSETRSRGAC